MCFYFDYIIISSQRKVKEILQLEKQKESNAKNQLKEGWDPLYTGKIYRDTTVSIFEAAAEASVAIFSALKRIIKK